MKMNKLVKDGSIILNGTRPKYEIEKEIFREYEKIQDIEEKLGITLETYFRLFEQDFVYAYDNHFEPHVNNLINIDTKAAKITIHNGFTFRTYKFADFGELWHFEKEPLEKRK